MTGGVLVFLSFTLVREPGAVKLLSALDLCGLLNGGDVGRAGDNIRRVGREFPFLNSYLKKSFDLFPWAAYVRSSRGPDLLARTLSAAASATRVSCRSQSFRMGWNECRPSSMMLPASRSLRLPPVYMRTAPNPLRTREAPTTSPFVMP